MEERLFKVGNPAFLEAWVEGLVGGMHSIEDVVEVAKTWETRGRESQGLRRAMEKKREQLAAAVDRALRGDSHRIF